LFLRYVRASFSARGKGPFRWVALSGDPADIPRNWTRSVMEHFAYDEHPGQVDKDGAHDKVAFQGLPSRICWLGYGERAQVSA